MKKANLYFLVTIILAIAACGSPAEDTTEAEIDFSLTEEGLSFVKLGDRLDSLRFPKGSTIKEELVTAQGYQWREMTVFLPGDKKIQIDGAFVDEGDPAGKLPLSTVNRIHIDNPDYPTKDGIKVGDTFADLVGKYGKENLKVVYIPSYEAIQVTVSNVNRLSFNLNDDSGTLAEFNNEGAVEIPVEKILPSSGIISIVVF